MSSRLNQEEFGSIWSMGFSQLLPLVRFAQGMRSHPETSLTRLQLAELLFEHLDFATSEFRDMKMQPALERAVRHKEILGA